MTMPQFRKAYALAEELSKTGDYSVDEAAQASQALLGYGYEQKHCTLKQYAIVFNWQTMQLNGVRDVQAVEQELEYRKNVILLDQ